MNVGTTETLTEFDEVDWSLHFGKKLFSVPLPCRDPVQFAVCLVQFKISAIWDFIPSFTFFKQKEHWIEATIPASVILTLISKSLCSLSFFKFHI